MKLADLSKEIRGCSLCKEHLPLGPNPVFVANPEAKIIIIGQAPGVRVHNSGIPWNDPSGVQLRKWLQVSDDTFYNDPRIAIMPMGFCYPGTGKSGDLPPRPECAEAWHELLLKQMPNLKLTLLIGQYAQKHYLKKEAKKNLTETVRNFQDYAPDFIPTPHPSPRNRFWMKKNPWFEQDIVPYLQARVADLLRN